MVYAYAGPRPARTEAATRPRVGRPRVTTPDPSKCGEYRGYRQHQRFGTPVCGPCKKAKRAYVQDRRHQERDAA